MAGSLAGTGAGSGAGSTAGTGIGSGSGSGAGSLSGSRIGSGPGVSESFLPPHCSSAGVSRLFWVLGPHWGPLNLPVFPPRLLTLYSKVALGKKTSVSMVEPETQFLVLGD